MTISKYTLWLLYFKLESQKWGIKLFIRRGANKSLAFLFPIFPLVAQPTEFFFDGLTKLEHRSHKCVELRGKYAKNRDFTWL
jgi:hypothetical protein